MLAAVTLGAAGCEPYRVEYHTRPSYYRHAAVGDLPDRIEMEDGTVIVYRERGDEATLEQHMEDQGEPTRFREEHDDGEVELRAFIPQHILANLVMCLRNEEYDLLWDQLLAEETRQAYEDRGGFEEFEDFMVENRRDLLAMLNRMLVGQAMQEVSVRRVENNIMRCEFRPQVRHDFKFRRIDMAYEGSDLKLLTIQ